MTEISLFGSLIRGDFFLVLALIIAVVFIWLIGSARKRKKNSGVGDEALVKLLSNPEVIKALNSGNEGLSKIIHHLENKEQSRNEDSMISSTSQKIINDIEWDVAGLIGVGVTIVLLFMVVSGTITQIPEQIFTGWLIILGYYFGKGSKT